MIVSVRGEQIAFDYFVVFHLLRAVAAEAAEFIVFVSERRGLIAVDAGSERIGHTDGFVVLGMRHEDRSLNALLIDDATKETLHAFRESIMREGRLQKTHAFDFVGGRIGSRRRDDPPAEAVADEMNALHLRSEFVDELRDAILADVAGTGFHLEISREVENVHGRGFEAGEKCL